MKQKIGLFLCLALLLTGCSYQTKTIRFGAADIGGMYYTVANAYAGLASEESSDLKFEVKNTAVLPVVYISSTISIWSYCTILSAT